MSQTLCILLLPTERSLNAKGAMNVGRHFGHKNMQCLALLIHFVAPVLSLFHA